MVIQPPGLWAHQEDFVVRLRASLKRHRRVVAYGTTGFGKTRVAKHILARAASKPTADGKSGYMLAAVYGRGLVDNLSESLGEEPRLPHGLILSGADTSPGCRVQVASIDSLLSWYCEGNAYHVDLTFDLIVFDETHSHLPKLKAFLALHDQKRNELDLSPSYVLGLSATPKCKGLADVYRDIVCGPSPRWLIENRYASSFRYLAGSKADLSRLVQRGDDYTKSSKAEATDGMQGDFVRDWLRYAESRPTIGFFPNLAQAEAALGMLTEAGIRAGFVHSKTKDAERRTLMASLESGEVEYLCNVGVFERGTNIPCVSCVQLCVVIGDEARYLQMIGRGSRTHNSKTDCLVLDHANNVARYGFWEDERNWTIDQSNATTSQAGVRPSIECPGCSEVYRGGACQSCGYEPDVAERKKQGLVFDGTELQEITQSPNRPQGKLKSNEQILINSLFRAAHSNRTWKQALGISYREAEKQGTKFTVPKRFTIAGKTHEAVPYGSVDGRRAVKAIYPFLTGGN